jgi:hypothetical protein
VLPLGNVAVEGGKALVADSWAKLVPRVGVFAQLFIDRFGCCFYVQTLFALTVLPLRLFEVAPQVLEKSPFAKDESHRATVAGGYFWEKLHQPDILCTRCAISQPMFRISRQMSSSSCAAKRSP